MTAVEKSTLRVAVVAVESDDHRMIVRGTPFEYRRWTCSCGASRADAPVNHLVEVGLNAAAPLIEREALERARAEWARDGGDPDVAVWLGLVASRTADWAAVTPEDVAAERDAMARSTADLRRQAEREALRRAVGALDEFGEWLRSRKGPLDQAELGRVLGVEDAARIVRERAAAVGDD